MTRTWEDQERKANETATAIAKALVGKTIASVRMPVKYPGNYEIVEILTTDGDRLTFSESTGCDECDPEKMGFGVQIDFGAR